MIKIINDYFISKFGEEAAKAVLKKDGNVIVGPDYSIYEPKEKSWESDLYVKEEGTAIRTQSRSRAQKYGLSWTFQGIHVGRSDPILLNPEVRVYFVKYIDTD